MNVFRRCLIGVAVLCVLSGSAGGQAVAWPPALRVDSRPQVTLTGDGLVLEWRAPDPQFVPHADGTTGISLPGYIQTTLPGEPQLPFASALVALPPGATPTLQVLLMEQTERPLPRPLALAPIPDGVQRDATGRSIGGAFAPSATMDRQADHTDPAHTGGYTLQQERGEGDAAIALEPAGVMRGVRLARVTFYPVRPAGDRLRVTSHLRASITFDVAIPGSASAQRADDPLLAALRAAVVNPDHVWPSASPLPNSQSTDRVQAGAGSAAIEVSAPGLTAITFKALLDMGYPVDSTDPHYLHLARGGTEVAAEWDGDDDALFEPGERLLFYAAPRSSRWTQTDVYFLSRDATPGLRMATRSADPAGQPAGVAWTDVTAEVNALYTPDCICKSIPPGRDGDRWTWDDLRRPGREAASYSIHTPAVDATQPATMTLWFIGYTSLAPNPDHRVKVNLNGAWLGNAEWDGKQAFTSTLSIPAGVLHSGDNSVALNLPGVPGVSVEGAWLDAFAVRYARSREPVGTSASFGTSLASSTIPSSTLPHRLYLPLVMRNFPGERLAFTVALASPAPYRAYDVTDSLQPQRLSGVWVDGNVVTVSDPLAGSVRRYLVTASDGILSPVRVRPVEDPWGFHMAGRFTGADDVIITHPAFVDALGPLISLRQSQGLTTTLVNVLGIYDAWGDGRPDPEAIRAFIANAYATWSPRPTFVLLVGDGSFDPRSYRPDSTPTLVPPFLADVDPWTGETAADNRYVAVDGDDALPDMLIGRLPVKTLAEAQTVIDKIVQYEAQPLPGGWNADVALVADDPDGAGDFAAESEIVATNYITSPFAPRRIYYTPPVSTAVAARQTVLERWNAGASIVQFTGHSSWQQWAAERLFHLDDLPMVRNGRRLPVVVEMTCFTGAFQRPEPTLDEDLVTLRGGGAVAAWGPTGLGINTGHHALAEGFYRAIFHTPVNTLGEAALAGKLELFATHLNLDLLDTFTLLGDPATRFNRRIAPWASHVYLPLTARP